MRIVPGRQVNGLAIAVQGAAFGYERQAPISVKYKGHDLGKDRWGRRMLSRTQVMSKHPPFSPPPWRPWRPWRLGGSILGVLGALAVLPPWRPWRLGGSNLGVLAVPSRAGTQVVTSSD
ncbi:MAG: hypothetical protein ACOX52_21080 [Verrucomicrobiota bacterium]